MQEGCRLAKRSLILICLYTHNTLKEAIVEYLCKSTFFIIQQDLATEFLKMNFILFSSRFSFNSDFDIDFEVNRSNHLYSSCW